MLNKLRVAYHMYKANRILRTVPIPYTEKTIRKYNMHADKINEIVRKTKGRA